MNKIFVFVKNLIYDFFGFILFIRFNFIWIFNWVICRGYLVWFVGNLNIIVCIVMIDFGFFVMKIIN